MPQSPLDECQSPSLATQITNNDGWNSDLDSGSDEIKDGSQYSKYTELLEKVTGTHPAEIAAIKSARSARSDISDEGEPGDSDSDSEADLAPPHGAQVKRVRQQNWQRPRRLITSRHGPAQLIALGRVEQPPEHCSDGGN